MLERWINIILKSDGRQLYSCANTLDAIQGILFVLFQGQAGEAYNLADDASDITLRELAGIAAKYADTKVVFDLPTECEKKGCSTAAKALLNAEKIKVLGWKPFYDISSGIAETINILRDIVS